MTPIKKQFIPRSRRFYGKKLLLGLAILDLLTAASANVWAEESPSAAAAPVSELKTVHAVTSKQSNDDRQQANGFSRKISGQTLERQHVQRLEDLQQLAPGLDVASTNEHDTRVTLRGIGDSGSNEINIGMADSVGLFLDHVHLSRPGMLSGDLTDIDSVQVLGGPQGGYYGFNTTGGVIDIRSRAPTFTPEADFKQSFGQRGYKQSQAMASGALGGAWAGRINISHTERGGYVRNVYTGNELAGSTSDGIRGQLLFQPDDHFNLRLTADWQHSRGRPVQVLARVAPIDGVDLFQQALTASGAHAVEGRRVDQDGESLTKSTQAGLSAVAEWNFDSGYLLRSVSAFRYFGFKPHLSDQLDIPLYDNGGTDVRDRTWQQSLRLESPTGPRFDYAIGLDYTGENMDSFAHDHYGAGSEVTAWYGGASNTGKFVQRWGQLDDEAFSAYMQGTWHLAPGWNLAGALRETYDTRKGSFRRVNKNPYDSGMLHQRGWLPAAQLNLSWDATEQLQVYTGVSYTEKAGTLNISSGAVSTVGTDSLYVDPEDALGAELGIKGDWLDHRLNVKADVFWTQLTHFQTTATDLVTNSNYLLNAGKLRSRGVETTLSARPWYGFSLDFNATLLDARYLNFGNAKCPAEVTLADADASVCSLTGSRVYRAPKFTYNIALRQEWSAADNGNWFASARWSYRTWSYGTLDDSRITRIDGYGLLGLSAGYEHAVGSHSWSASVWLDNATNRNYYRTLAAGSYGSAYGVLGDPRTLGVTLEYRY